MERDRLLPTDDHRHDLRPGQHEAFYFLFGTSDGGLFGFLRTLFGPETVLEMTIIRLGRRTWAYQRRSPAPPRTPGDASGASVKMRCTAPWQSWVCSFQGTMQEIEGQAAMSAALDLTFTAINEPALYRFGAYNQAQQDGRVVGQVRIGTEEWNGEMICFRDHSWGERPVGAAVRWTLASVPDRLYAVVVETKRGPAGFGRFRPPDGPFRPVILPTVTPLDGAYAIEDPTAGTGRWIVRRIAPPLVGYLGPGGQEAMRTTPQPGDLLRDELGPALFITPEGEERIGFLEQAEALEWPNGY